MAHQMCLILGFLVIATAFVFSILSMISEKDSDKTAWFQFGIVLAVVGLGLVNAAPQLK